MVAERTLCPILVGRRHELSALDDALLDAARGDGRLVALAGDAGIGKSRLAQETQRRAARLGFSVLRGACAATDLGIPYLPFVEAATNELAHADAGRVRERLGAGGAGLAGLFPDLARESGRRLDDTPDSGKLNLFESFVGLFSTLAGSRPLLLVVEDLHWADPSTRELVDYLAHRISSLPLVLLTTLRTDELVRRDPLLAMVHGWRRSDLAEVLDIPPLTGAEVGRMSQAIFDDEVSNEFRDYLFERTEGSPLALEEMLREAIDRGDIFRSEAGWDRKPIARFRLPRAVSEAVLLRADRLSPVEVRVLEGAAVIGRSFTYDVLAAITDLAEDLVSSAVEELVIQQFLEADAELRGRFRFRHALIQEAIYDQILSPRREKLHLHTAEALRDASAPAMEVGSHLLLGGRTSAAVPLLLSAADDAMSNHAAASAVELYQRVMPHVTDPKQRGRLLERLGEALWRSGQPLAAERYLRQAVEALTAIGQPARAARCRYLLGACLHDEGRIQDEELEYEHALSILKAFSPTEDEAMVHLRLARLRWSRCDNAGTKVMAQRAIEVADSAGADLVRIWARAYLGAASVHLGSVDEGIDLLEGSWRDAMGRRMYWAAAAVLRLDMSVRNHALRNREIAPLMRVFRSLPGTSTADEIVASCLEATIAFDDCQLAECRGHLDVAAALVSRSGHELLLEEVTVLRGAWHLAMDQLDEARSVLPSVAAVSAAAIEWMLPLGVTLELAGHGPRAAAEVADVGLRAAGEEIEAIVSEAAVEAFIAAGRLAEARALLTDARHFAGPGRDPYLQRARARVSLAEGHPAEASRALEGLCQAFAGAGERWEELRTRLLLAEAFGSSGRLAEASEQLDTTVAKAQPGGVGLFLRLAQELREQLGIAPAPASAPAARAATGVAVDAATAPERLLVLAAGQPEASDLWEWAIKEARHCHGVRQGVAGRFVARFERSPADQGWIDALQLAVGLRDKARLLDAPVAVRVIAGGASGDVTSLPPDVARPPDALADAIVIHGDPPPRAREWLGARGLAPASADHDVLAVPQRWAAGRELPHGQELGKSQLESAQRNLFVLEGDFWSVSYAGLTVRLKNVKGLHDIGRLLASRGTELAAIDLVGRTSVHGEQQRASLAGSGFAAERDAGEVLDHEARQQYRARLVELEEELAEATSANDVERATRIGEERSFLLSELASAVGLHGTSRRALDPAERARKAVTWRIRDAINRAEAVHPQLGRHLRRSVRTGTFCAYDPPEPTQWVLTR